MLRFRLPLRLNQVSSVCGCVLHRKAPFVHDTLNAMFQKPICQRHWIILPGHFCDLRPALVTKRCEVEQVTGGSSALMRPRVCTYQSHRPVQSSVVQEFWPWSGLCHLRAIRSGRLCSPSQHDVLVGSLLDCVLSHSPNEEVTQLCDLQASSVLPSLLPPVSAAHFRPCSLKRCALSVRPGKRYVFHPR